MLNVGIDQKQGILTLTPDGPLTTDDFERATRVVDQYLNEHPVLQGVVIHASQFPGWESFGSLISHLSFVRDHHRTVRRVALVSDSDWLTFMPALMNHFVAADVRHFPSQHTDAALDWIRE